MQSSSGAGRDSDSNLILTQFLVRLESGFDPSALTDAEILSQRSCQWTETSATEIAIKVRPHNKHVSSRFGVVTQVGFYI